MRVSRTFPTPKHIGAAAHAAIDANFTKYTTNSGTDELKKAIVARYKTDYGVEYATNEVIVTAGGKQALFNAVMVLFGEGDEVITHMPGWPTLVEQIKLADATPVIVHTHAEDGFTLRAETFLNALTPKTRGIIINSPGNPTGALISEQDLEILAKESAKRGIWILLDLCYEKLIYDPTPHNLPGVLARTMRDRAILCGSASKAYAMTGWRCGWTVGPAAVVSACNALQSHSTSNVCSITQKAVVAGLNGPQECVTEMLDEYRRRRDQLCIWLGEEPRLRLVKPAGAFYLFPDVSDFLSPGRRPDLGGARAVAARRSSCGADAGRGLRRTGLRPSLLRRVDGRSEARCGQDHRASTVGRASANDDYCLGTTTSGRVPRRKQETRSSGDFWVWSASLLTS